MPRCTGQVQKLGGHTSKPLSPFFHRSRGILCPAPRMYLNQSDDRAQSQSVLFHPCLSLTNTLNSKTQHPMLSFGESPARPVTINSAVQWARQSVQLPRPPAVSAPVFHTRSGASSRLADACSRQLTIPVWLCHSTRWAKMFQ